MIQNNIKKIALSLIAFASPIILNAQDSTSVAMASPKSGLDINILLAIIMLILLIPLYLTGKTLIFALSNLVNEKKKNLLGVILLLGAFSQLALAQATEEAVPVVTESPYNGFTIVLSFIILAEIILIMYFTNQTLKVHHQSAGSSVSSQKSMFQTFWEKINSLKPIEEEANIDTGHSYDGIRELDNITPPWFTTAFIASIIFAIVYLYRYHVSKSAPLQIAEFNTEMAIAEKEKALYLSKQANNVDENSVKMLAAADIEVGKKTFIEKCAACHAANGGSVPGGVGPNLTDDYWIHGGSIKDIFKTIKYGWPEKGMISWKDQLSPNQIAQVTSFIKSIKGSNPAGAKEPQGELYTESNLPPTDSTATVAAIDTLKASN